MNTLVDYRHRRKFSATDGEPGGKRRCHGGNGADIVLKVPEGTVIMDAASGKVIADMSGENRRQVVLKGGKGGNGNKMCIRDRSRPVYQHITVYEEVGHGGSASVPEGVTDILSVDMGCVGDGLECKEHQVSICVKDSGGPYSYDFTGELIAAAKANGIDYAADVYPHYGSDVEATLRGGADARHALIGAGVYASHGYERSHVDGVKNTLELLAAYLDK